MSNATDLAELDAAIAEHELTEEEAEALRSVTADGIPLAEAIEAVLADRQGTSSPPPPQDAPPAELGEPSEKQLRDLERQTDRHIERVRTIMGGHVAGFDVCDTCGGVGLTPPGPRPQEHPYFKACETCAGFGQVKTGSLRGGNEARDCPACKGRGYLEALDAQGQPLANQPTTPPAPVIVPQPELNAVSPPVAPQAAPAEPHFGTPTWMGDPGIGGQ